MSEHKKRRESDSIEQLGRARDTEESTRPTGTSAEITLDLVARTAIELHKLNSNDVMHGYIPVWRGQEAIEFLSIWSHQLEIEKITGAAAKKAEELLSLLQAEKQEDSKRREELEHQAMQRAEWTKIPKTRPIPFAKAAMMIFPKKRVDRMEWLERTLKHLAEEKSPFREEVSGICRQALKQKSVPEGLIPHLKASRDNVLKAYKSQIAKLSGQKGGIQRAKKYSKNKTAAENDSSKRSPTTEEN